MACLSGVVHWRSAHTGRGGKRTGDPDADGFSNHYPDLTGSHERPAIIALAHIAPWCVPGHREDDEFRYEVGPWLRLEVVAPETLSFWTEDSDEPTVERRDASIILDEQAVRSLRDDLTAWLKRDKVRPA